MESRLCTKAWNQHPKSAKKKKKKEKLFKRNWDHKQKTCLIKNITYKERITLVLGWVAVIMDTTALWTLRMYVHRTHIQ